MKRIPHIIKKNHTNSIPTRIIFLDTESTQTQKGCMIQHTLRLGWAVYVNREHMKTRGKMHEEWFFFRTPHEFWRWAEGKTGEKKKLYIIAHNQNFDYMILDGFQWMEKLGYSMKKWIIDSNMFYIEYMKGKKKVVIMDSLNVLKGSIASFGKLLGLPKLHVDFSSVSDEELSKYCQRDVEILKRMFLQYIDFLIHHNLGKFRFTIAGQAYTAFRHRFMKHRIYIHTVPAVEQLEINSYRGGRTEAFFLGQIRQKIYYMDVNSLYPFVMLRYEYPIRLLKYGHTMSLDYLQRILERYAVIAKVKIYTDENVYGIKKERLIFPIGRYTTVLCSEELRYALQHGHIEKIYEYAVYEKAPIFSEYVKFFSLLKEKYSVEKNLPMRQLAKLFLNSLYGKFGQRNEKIERIGEDFSYAFEVTPVIDISHMKSYTRIQIGHDVFRKEPGKELAYDSFPAIASEVSANARMHLWYLMKKAGMKNVYYIDTDSLFVNESGYRNLKDEIHDVALGKLKVEGISDTMEIRNVKDYTFGEKTHIKGVRKDAEKVSHNKYRTYRFWKFRTALRKGSIDRVIQEEYIKVLQREYKKGKVDENGYVSPYVLLE